MRAVVDGLPQRREVPAEVQFEVARNAVADAEELGTARLRVGRARVFQIEVVLDCSSAAVGIPNRLI